MKYFLTLLTLIAFTLGAQSQNCSSWKKSHCNKYMTKQCEGLSALLAAADDVNIISIKDDMTGKYKFMRMMECPTTGSVTYQSVSYNEASQSFDCKSVKCDPSLCKTKPECLKKCSPSTKAMVTIAVQPNKQVRT